MDESIHEPTWIIEQPSLQNKLEWLAKNRY
jgi:hypothetical protein